MPTSPRFRPRPRSNPNPTAPSAPKLNQCYSDICVFRGHHRKVRVFFGLSDIFLTALAFGIAYWTRTTLNERNFAFEHDFFLTAPVVVLLLGWSMLMWLALGGWWRIYDR